MKQIYIWFKFEKLIIFLNVIILLKVEGITWVMSSSKNDV